MREPDHTEPGGQLAGESVEDYHRFCIYRNLGPARSLRDLVGRTGLSLDRLKQLSAKWHWPQRAALWDIVEGKRRWGQILQDARSGREALLQEAADWQKLAGRQASGYLRRNAEGELELTRDLSPGEAIHLWRVGWEAERQLMRYAKAEPSEEPLPDDPDSRMILIIARYYRRGEAYFRALGIERSDRFSPGKALLDLAFRPKLDDDSEQRGPDREDTGGPEQAQS